MSNKTVSAIVVTNGTNDYLKNCLFSLQRQTYSCLDIIVIDNALNPDFSRRILKAFPLIRLYQSQENLFYCRSLNRGINLSRQEFILCLNDDVVLDEHFVERALQAFFLDPKIGMVSGKILRAEAQTIDSCGLVLSLWRTAKERGYASRDCGQFEKPGYIFGVSGAAAFYRKAMLEEIKEGQDYFDPDFCFFYEDLDLAWRANRLGWKCYYVPDALVYHWRGGSARFPCGIGRPQARRYLKDNLQAHLVKNRYLVLIKNESLGGFLLHLPLIFLYDLAVWGYILFFKPAQIKHFIANFAYLKGAWRKRKFYRQRKSYSSVDKKNSCISPKNQKILDN